MDLAAGSLVVLVMPEESAANPDKWVWRMREPLTLQIVCAKHSYATLQEISDRVGAAIPVLEEFGVTVVAVGPWEPANAVRVLMVDPDERARSLLGAIAGPDAPLLVEKSEPLGSRAKGG